MNNSPESDQGYQQIHESIAGVVEAARSAAARSVNRLMTATYWEIGRHIVLTEQGGHDRAGYGDSLVERLAADLTERFGRGFSRQNLWQMRAFHLGWPEERILQTLSGESVPAKQLRVLTDNSTDLALLSQAFPLPWSAYVRLLGVKNEQARAFYEAEAFRAGWSVRQLDRQVNSQFYERAALSRDKAAMLRQAETDTDKQPLTAADAIKDPFVLEFLNLKDQYSESDLEESLIQHLTDFLLELGDDFAFVGRQR
ncbi:hypothetical protein IMCC3135_17060 [Granulosicoccus antarcticus IMCC3135]|uniref:YhcG N-terminal domain-containing protein n=1 Tax=Granulosicoccus antarcticus IMCC3135 TaxID=1192854 RepID=A0A2Z2P1L7_9GAMM|nr:hypothetical protein IMCC3135_17060 [Granulosicoccus antarcticus IMCC3135]